MDFGRVPEKDLITVDFNLPDEPAFNQKALTGKNTVKPALYIGCAKWGRKEWVGKIYPKGTKEKDFLDHYVNHYNCIELNAASYKMPTVNQVKMWGQKTKNLDFLFCPKMVRYVYPNGNLEKEIELTNNFLKAIKAFGKNEGPVFLLLGENYSPAKKTFLFQYLEAFPTDTQLFVELRHPVWLSDEKVRTGLFEKFQQLHIGTIITDTAGRRDMAHMHLTIPKAFVRFVGNSLHETDYKRCDDWVKRIKLWLGEGLEELFFFMHMHDEATSPELTVYLVDQLNKECKLNLMRPKFEGES